MIDFVTPSRLALLLGVAALAAVYAVVSVRGRRRYEVRFTNLALLASVAPRRPGWRRHLPAALLLSALAALVVSLARPTREAKVPRERATIVLAIDVSLSMDATDVPPNRLEAAKAAAVSFTGLLPEQINLGLVAFAGTAAVVVPPTTDRDEVTEAIGRLDLAEATAIGEAVVASLGAIESVPAAESGEPVPAHIVVMSDGETTVGTPDAVAAELASDAGVPVTTIGFGTDAGTITYEGTVQTVPVNQAKLDELAEATGGRSFAAATGEELGSIYEDIGSAVGFDTEEREVGRWFVTAGLVLAALSALATLAVGSRFP